MCREGGIEGRASVEGGDFGREGWELTWGGGGGAEMGDKG